MSGEIGLGTLDTKNWREINIQIEEDLNNYLKSINYSNENMLSNSVSVYLFCLPGPYLDSP
jgi:hypothetical protein